MESWQGRVTIKGGEDPVGGVAVSDGFQVVTTDADGRFVIPASDEQAFVFVSSPPGYTMPVDAFNRPQFHRAVPCAGQMDFELQPASQENHSFALLCDLHLGRGDGRAQFARTVIPRVNAHRPSFVLVNGDISFQEGIIDEFLDLQRELEAPVYHAIGNHEMMMDSGCPKRAFQRLLGPTYYSFGLGRVHYIVLDGCTPAPYRSGWQNVLGFVDEAQLRWLEQDLQHVPAADSVVVFVHIPIVSEYSERRGLAAKEEPAWEIINDERVVDVLARHPVRYVFQGHMHENEHIHHRGIHFVETASVSGAWWAGDNIDGSPQGFRFAEVQGSTLRSSYVAAASGPAERTMGVEVVGRPEAGDDASVELLVNVFDGDPRTTKVESREKGNGYWAVMKPVPMNVHPHKWRGTLRTSCGGRPGLEIEVRVSGTTQDGAYRARLDEKGALVRV